MEKYEYNEIIEKLNCAKEKRKQLELKNRTAWEDYQKQQEEIGREIKFHQDIGDEAAANMRECFKNAAFAFETSQKAEAKELSEKGRYYERQARDANVTKDRLIQESKSLRSSMDYIQVELKTVKDQINELQNKLKI